MVHTSSALAKLRVSGSLVALVHRELKKVVAPGITTEYLDKLAEEIIMDNQGSPTFKGYKGYPFATCCSVNDVIVHGFPNRIELQEGDLLTVDVGVTKEDYIGDAAFSVGVGELTKEATELLDASYGALKAAIDVVKDGVTVGTLGSVIEAYALSKGYNTVKNFIGHSCGKNLHESISIPNYGRPVEGIKLKTGSCICIEPILIKGLTSNHRLADGWTVVSDSKEISVHVEHQIIVHNNYAEIITI